MMNKIKAYYQDSNSGAVYDVISIDFIKKVCVLTEDLNDEIVPRFKVHLDKIKFVYNTGFMDINKTEIYSHDIIKVPRKVYQAFREPEWEGDTDGYYLIEWKEGGFMKVDITDDINKFNFSYLWLLKNYPKTITLLSEKSKELLPKVLDCEVITNEFENNGIDISKYQKEESRTM